MAQGNGPHEAAQLHGIPDELAARIAAIARDRESAASTILAAVLGIVRDAQDSRAPMLPVARSLCRAQPSMAPVWNAVLAALASADGSDRLERFAQRVARAPAALARFAAECFADDTGPLSLVTISFSGSVVTALDAIRRVRPVRLSCSESRPALEGRRLATQMATSGVPVTCYADAALAQALDGADAVLVGADAIAPEWFLNKSGTRMLAAAATLQGIPVYVAATRDKFVSRTLAARLSLRDGAPEEIWDAPPPAVEVRNPYFERTTLDLVTTVISDAGLLGAGVMADVCEAADDPLTREALENL